MKLLKNKRADIPITILVIGVLAICGLAILSFIISDKVKLKSDNLGLDVFEKLYTDFEKYVFYKNVNSPFAETIKPPYSNIESSTKKIIIKNYNPTE